MIPKFVYSCVYLRPDVRYLVLDFETTNLEFGSALVPENRILVACWRIVTNEGVTIKSHRGGELTLKELVDDIKSVDYVVAHNAKFEAQWLKRCGVELRDVLFFDTMLAEWVILGNRKQGKSLEDLAGKYLGDGKQSLVNKMIHEWGINPEEISQNWLEEYCHKDVELTDKIRKIQLDILKKEKLLHLVHLRNLTCACLADIEFNGLYLDKERVNEEYTRLITEMNEYSQKLAYISGGINLNSGKQLGKLLYETLGFEELKQRGKVLKTAGGAPLTDADSISQLKAKTKVQKEFLELYKAYRQCSVLLSKNVDFFEQVCKERGSLFFGEFKQGTTATGRLSSGGRKQKFSDGSSKGAQLQNLPRQYKKLFKARKEGYVIGEFDGSQLEFRTAAGMAEDAVACDEIDNDVDVHSVTAETLTSAGEPTTRQEAKPVTFKPLYFGSYGTPAVMEYCKFFKEKYSKISSMQLGWIYEVINNGVFRTPYGLKLYWPKGKLRRDGLHADCTEIANAPVQGLATGEIIPIALVHFWHRTRDKDVMITNTIHDSVICEFPEELSKEFEELAVQCMTFDVYEFLRRVYKYDLKVTLGTGIKVSPHWGDTKREIQFNVTPDGVLKFKVKE